MCGDKPKFNSCNGSVSKVWKLEHEVKEFDPPYKVSIVMDPGLTYNMGDLLFENTKNQLLSTLHNAIMRIYNMKPKAFIKCNR